MLKLDLCKNNFFNNIKVLNFSRLLFIFSISFFIFYSIIQLHSHILNIDEINAWNIARNVSFIDLFKLMKYEGHLFVWYTIIMPFAKNNLFFPYSMQIINLLFCFGAILIMWRFAPFNPVIKTFITFSLPFKIYSLYARCYSIGIFILFVICSLYPKRLEHPIIYSLLIIILANTSVMALVGAFVLGILFLFDIFKSFSIKQFSKINYFSVFFIFLFGALLVLLQLGDFSIPFYAQDSDYYNFQNHFLKFYLGNPPDFKHLSLVFVYSFLLLLSPAFF